MLCTKKQHIIGLCPSRCGLQRELDLCSCLVLSSVLTEECGLKLHLYSVYAIDFWVIINDE